MKETFEVYLCDHIQNKTDAELTALIRQGKIRKLKIKSWGLPMVCCQECYEKIGKKIEADVLARGCEDTTEGMVVLEENLN